MCVCLVVWFLIFVIQVAWQVVMIGVSMNSLSECEGMEEDTSEEGKREWVGRKEEKG